MDVDSLFEGLLDETAEPQDDAASGGLDADSLQCVEMIVTLGCPYCPSKIPVPGLLPEIRCYGCGSTVSLGNAWERLLFGGDETYKLLSRTTKSLGDHQPDLSDVLGGAPNPSHRQARLRAPTCPCGHTLALEAIEGAAPDGEIECPRCQTKTPIQDPSNLELHQLLTKRFPGIVRIHHLLANRLPGIKYVVGETAAEHAARPAAEPVTLSCTNCGGELQADGTTRMVKCPFCNATEVLSDELWNRFPHVPKTRPFYLLILPDRKRLYRARYRKLSVAKRDASNPDTPVDALEYLASDACHVDDDFYGRFSSQARSLVRMLVAMNAATPEPVLLSLVTRGDKDVRLAVLARFEKRGGSKELEAALEPVIRQKAEHERHVQRKEAERTAEKEAEQRELKAILAVGKVFNRVGVIITIAAFVGVIGIAGAWLLSRSAPGAGAGAGAGSGSGGSHNAQGASRATNKRDHPRTYTSPKLLFSVQMPHYRHTGHQLVPTLDGLVDAQTVSFSNSTKPGLIAVWVTPMPFVPGPKRIFDDEMANVLDVIAGRISRQHSVTVNGVPGREVQATGRMNAQLIPDLSSHYARLVAGKPADPRLKHRDTPVSALIRMFYQNAILYQVMAIYPTGASGMSADAKTVVRSFKPLVPKPKGEIGEVLRLHCSTDLRPRKKRMTFFMRLKFTLQLEIDVKPPHGIAVQEWCRFKTDHGPHVLGEREYQPLHHVIDGGTKAKTLIDLGPVDTFPEACLVSFSVRSGLNARASLGDFCWAAGRVTTGRCRM